METVNRISYNQNYETPNKNLKNQISFENVYEKYKSEFIDNCEEIIIQKEQDFLKTFFSKMKLILKEYYGESIFESNKNLPSIINKCEQYFYKEIYKPMYNLCINSWKKYINYFQKKNTKKDYIYLSNFRNHCYYDQKPIHVCKGRFITVTDINTNKILYVICSNCKMCYYESSILMYCINCKKEYYSSIISIVDKVLPPATWEKYHCNAMINEQMSCIKCGDKFWIKNSKLFCKKCKFLISPLDVFWTCIICHKEFKSYAKVYNPLEYKIIKLAIRNARLNKKITKPKEVPCGCFNKNEIDDITFYHKLYGKCNGVLYYGTISGKGIVVCSLCKSMGSLNKFNWYCPKCGKNFITKQVKIYTFEENNNSFINDNNNINNNSKNSTVVSNRKYESLNNITNTNSNTNNSLVNNASPNISKKNSNNLNYNDYNKNTNNSRNSEITNLRAFNNKKEENGIFQLHEKLIGNNNLDYPGNKRRNLSISLMNKQFSKSRVNLKSSNNTTNYENTIDNEDFDDDYMDKRDNIIKHPNRRVGHLSINKNNLLNKSLQSWRSNYENNENIKLSKESNSKNKKSNKYSNNYKNFQIFIPKRTINLFPSKKENQSNNVSRKASSNDRYCDFNNNLNSINDNNNNTNNDNYYDFNFDNPNNNNKGFNRFRLNFNSPSSERKNLQIKFNEQETEHREKIRELSKKKNLEIESPIVNLNEKYSSKLSPYSNYNEKTEFEKEFFKTDINLNHISQLKTSLSNNRYSQNEKLTNSFLSKSPNNEKKKLINNFNLSTEQINEENSNNNNLIKSEILIFKKKSEENLENEELQSFDFNDYSIITQLGQGTFGKIYLVQNSEGEIYSMKKIILTEELDLLDIIKEYNLCHKLRHSNIVKILGLYHSKLDSTTFVIYILMELGLLDWEKEINNKIEKKTKYSEEDLINIIKQLVKALSFLQKKNVSHRDIKPHNVLVFKDQIYKIADFGEAKQISKINQNQQINTLRGTELYMSPLLYNGLRTNQIDIKHNLFKSDVYSLGLSILYAATLNIDNIYEIRKFIDMDDVRKFIVEVFNGNFSQKFVDLIERMLEINEKFRPDFIELEDIVSDL